MTLKEFNKYNNNNTNANLPEWKRNQPTAWGCQSNQPTGRGGVGVNSYDDRFSNSVTYGGVTYGGTR